MLAYEYQVVPAPKRGVKAKGAKTPEERFAVALAEVMNALGAQGWDYVRSDMLPCEERQGLTGKATVYHTVLVFRRPVGGAQAAAVATMPQPVMSPVAVPAVVAPAPRAVEAPLNPAPPLGPAERLAAE